MMTTRTGRMTRTAILGLSISSLATYVDCPGARENGSDVPALACSDFSMVVVPGTCELFGNPCESSREWLNPDASLPDGFQLLDRPASVYVRRDVSNGVTTRSVCVAEDAGTINNDSIVFKYGYDTFDRGYLFGTGHMTLYAASPLQASVSATPARIRAGESSQLVASVSGGIPPYSYSWLPTTGLSGTNHPIPVATPVQTTTYELMVTDAGGQYLGARPGQDPPFTEAPAAVTVSVEFELHVTANPQVIEPGQPSQLAASGGGGRRPYTFIWAPADWMNDPAISNPAVAPPVTTTYTVTVTDADGQALTGAVTVGVVSDVVAHASATPEVVGPGGSSQLAVTVQGGTPPYSFSWTPVEGLDRPTAQDPVATPAATTRYVVTVTDASGIPAPSAAEVTVTVSPATPPSPAPTASFTFTRVQCTSTTPCSNGATTGQEVFLDGSNSAGNIVSYTWEFDWTPASPDAVNSEPMTSVVLADEGNRGNIILTVTASDGQTASVSQPSR